MAKFLQSNKKNLLYKNFSNIEIISMIYSKSFKIKEVKRVVGKKAFN
jgi:hypothetical protein